MSKNSCALETCLAQLAALALIGAVTISLSTKSATAEAGLDVVMLFPGLRQRAEAFEHLARRAYRALGRVRLGHRHAEPDHQAIPRHVEDGAVVAGDEEIAAGQAGDPVERAGSRPDYAALIYGAGRAIPGEVLKDYPPTFLLSAAGDQAPSLANAQLFADLTRAGAIAEM